MPVLDWAFFDKNPVKMFLARHGLWKSSSAIAKFALDRMRERKLGIANRNSPSLVSQTRNASDPEKQDHTGSRRSIDFLDRFRQSQKEHPDFMTDARVLAASVSLLVAGSDSTGASLSAIFYFLIRNPRCYAKLMEELDTAEAEGRLVPHAIGLVSWADAQKLSYLDAVIQETFRMYPAAGILLERHVPRGGAFICGEHIPSGTIVGCNAWVLHRRQEVFGSDVEVFRPERWLETSEAPLRDMKAENCFFVTMKDFDVHVRLRKR